VNSHIDRRIMFEITNMKVNVADSFDDSIILTDHQQDSINIHLQDESL
jgi:hypothetical protein